ncbi:MAG TPA: glycoside hydrolase family 57 protein [Candidatus Eisenbacteria bacterium]|nr:glycoside hydrolase family 57 protein [Candidatus Eisenbacteria bacterium]
MSSELPPVELVFLWHHHQPDYRSPRDGVARLPWVRLHATKDYLDMALHLEAHPGVHAAFNFVPSLLDQLDQAAAGGRDELFALLAGPIDALEPAARVELAARCAIAPRHAFERWPRYGALVARAARAHRGGPELTDDELLALACWFQLAWIDPMLLSEPEARAALARGGDFTLADRDALLALSDRLLGRVVPAYRALAGRGQIELSCSPYDHPILPLLVDVKTARRARPDLPLPAEPFAEPLDAVRQIGRGRARHAQAFGAPPAGMWPSEGGVSPEVAELAAAAGVRWIATDEGVLWRSLAAGDRLRERLYLPWRVPTPSGDLAILFRDHELSDRIGFVYQHWEAREAVDDFIARLRRIARDWTGPAPPVVSVILDGENCWEHYAEDGGPFLEALYAALEAAPDIGTRTPSEVLASRRDGDAAAWPVLTTLHSGSWIDADFHIWIGHPEKNRAWDLLSRARKALAGAGATPEDHAPAWEALDAAEGSDWFWWFGDDHFTPDKKLFDAIYREHLTAVYEDAALAPPAWLEVPITRPARAPGAPTQPLGFVHPVLDGRPTHFYEWYAAGRYRLQAGGGAMHRRAGLARDLYLGFDAERLWLRVDFVGAPPGAGVDLTLEILSPRTARVRVSGLAPGRPPVTWDDATRQGAVAGAEACVDSVLELAIPFAGLGLTPGESLELLLRLVEGAEPLEVLPADELVRLAVPDASYEAMMWSA